MFCEKCGNKLSNDALFCSKCGSKVDILDLSEESYQPITDTFVNQYSNHLTVATDQLLTAPVVVGLCRRLKSMAIFKVIGGTVFLIIFFVMMIALLQLVPVLFTLYGILVGSFLLVLVVCSFFAAFSNLYSAYKDLDYSKKITAMPVGIVKKYEFDKEDKERLFGLITKTASNVCDKLIKEYVNLNKDTFDKIEKFVLIQNNTKEISINFEIELQEIKKSLIIMPKENDMPSIKIILKSFEEIC